MSYIKYIASLLPAILVVPVKAASPLETADVTAISSTAIGLIDDLIDMFLQLTPIIAAVAVGFFALRWVGNLVKGRIG